MNNTILIKLTDGGLVDYKDDVQYYSGCPTCDYGEELLEFIEHEDEAVNNSCKVTDKILREFSVTEIKGN